jgi:DNA polymerase-3 subunit beta
MKLQVLQEDFSKAISIASRFTSTRAQLPILGNILLSASRTKLLIASTNLEVSISISVGAQVEKEGEITVPSRVFSDLVSNLPSGQISLQAEKEQLKVSTQGFSSSVSGMNSSDFPSVPKILGKKAIKFSKEDLIDALSQVSFAASIDETRPILTGVLFIFERGSLTLVATDGFRLSQKKIFLKGVKGGRKIILPKNALNEVSRLSGDTEELSFSFKDKDSQVVFGLSNAVLSSRILEGEFPSFEKIIPKDSNYKVNLDREELLRAVKLAAVFARDSANIVGVSLKKDSIEISAESANTGQQKTQVDAKVEGDIGKKGFEINFNYRFLEDLLNALEGEEIQIEFSNPNAPGVFTDSKDKNFLHLIMPVRIQS